MNDVPSLPSDPSAATPPPAPTPHAGGRSVTVGDAPAPVLINPAAKPRTSSGVIYAIAGVVALALITVMVLASTWKGESPSTAAAPGGTSQVAGPAAGSVAAMMSEGSPTAPNVLVEYADYRCPFCGVWARQTHPQLQKLIDSGQLRMEFRDMTMFGQNSVDTAAAARAAGKQGKFWPYWHAIWAKVPTSGHPDFSESDFMDFARTAGVPKLGDFAKDLKDPAVKKQIEAESALEQKRGGISAVPYFLLNNRPINGNQDASVFMDIINRTVTKQ